MLKGIKNVIVAIYQKLKPSFKILRWILLLLAGIWMPFICHGIFYNEWTWYGTPVLITEWMFGVGASAWAILGFMNDLRIIQKGY